MQNLARTLCRRTPLIRTPPVVSNSLPLGVASSRQLSAAAWNLGVLNHTAIAVPDLQKSITFYRDVLKAAVSEPEDLPDHGVTVVFVNLPNTKIELLYPLGENSPIAGFLKKNKDGGIHHVCIEVDDIESAVREVREKGVRTLGENTKIGAHGKPVMFLHPKDCGGVLMELEQK
ncbi:ethylmalonyl-CoA/methylmalonyl-CoA epimerase-like [Bolinopsis microptera]|uniref:ethylmalonyl-CoA/methylmalonyl-CoA epimerase-like n=1 Tax=Bolinopsis microptera TaxID=2820187 RepID=UPI00307A50BD